METVLSLPICSLINDPSGGLLLVGTKGIGGHCRKDPFLKLLDLHPSGRIEIWLMVWYWWNSLLAYRNCLKGPGELMAVIAPRWGLLLIILENRDVEHCCFV